MTQSNPDMRDNSRKPPTKDATDLMLARADALALRRRGIGNEVARMDSSMHS